MNDDDEDVAEEPHYPPLHLLFEQGTGVILSRAHARSVKVRAITKRGIKIEGQSFTCSNPKCKRVANLITVHDLSSKNPVSYRGCPYCLTEMVTEKTPIEKVAELARPSIKPAQQPSSETQKCPHHFGYLSQRSSEEEIPEECLACEKVVKCIVSKPKTPTVVKQMEKSHVGSLKSNSFTPEIEAAIKTTPLPTEPSGNQFKVENLSMLYAPWSNTVRINRQTLSGWGGKIKEVEIETVDGKRTRCKVQPMEDSKKGIIEIPDKMQRNLEIGKGELVRVKPIIE